MKRPSQPNFAWAVTGSGHYLHECLDILQGLEGADAFLSRAAAEVLPMYGVQTERLKAGRRVFRDTSASGSPVGLFYEGHYHTLVIAPATSNTVAKFVMGISDNLVTNVFAQAGKCRIPSIVLACDTAEEVDSHAPGGLVKVYPRPVDLENTERLRRFPDVTVVATPEELERAIEARRKCLSTSCF